MKDLLIHNNLMPISYAKCSNMRRFICNLLYTYICYLKPHIVILSLQQSCKWGWLWTHWFCINVSRLQYKWGITCLNGIWVIALVYSCFLKSNSIALLGQLEKILGPLLIIASYINYNEIILHILWNKLLHSIYTNEWVFHITYNTCVWKLIDCGIVFSIWKQMRFFSVLIYKDLSCYIRDWSFIIDYMEKNNTFMHKLILWWSLTPVFYLKWQNVYRIIV